MGEKGGKMLGGRIISQMASSVKMKAKDTI